MDCKQDVIARNPANPYTGPWLIGAGYPVDKTRNDRGLWFYTDDVNDSDNASNTSLVLYSANYLRWYYGPTGYSIESRLRIAKDAVSGLISSTPGVDFGLAVFNRNDENDNNGGRIIRIFWVVKLLLQMEKLGNKICWTEWKV